MTNEHYDDNFVEHISDFLGETVTIYTTSGGQSGCGFTGCVISVNHCFVRLITRIGSAPGCAVGSSCRCCNRVRSHSNRCCNDELCETFRNAGSVCDIPIDRIACFVHNAV